MNSQFRQYIAPAINAGAIGILPTDTIYGIVGSALNKKAVLKIYRLRKRNPKKAVIVLIGSTTDLAKFGVGVPLKVKKILKKVWPGPVSVILPIAKSAARKRFAYLHGGTGAIAFRLPGTRWLREFLKSSGPLAAPSANFEGMQPAATIKAAKKYFGDQVDFYIDAGSLSSKPSTLVKIKNGKMTVIRRGAVDIRGSLFFA